MTFTWTRRMEVHKVRGVVVVRRVVDVYSQAITTSTTACYLPENTRERRDLQAMAASSDRRSSETYRRRRYYWTTPCDRGLRLCYTTTNASDG